MKRQQCATLLCVLSGLCLVATTVNAAMIQAEVGGVQVLALPEPAPGPGYSAATIVLRATDPEAKLVTFENLLISGDVHQTWLSGVFAEPTPILPIASPTYPQEWIVYDSHVLITDDKVGGGAGNSHAGISETNDGAIGTIDGLPDAAGFPPESGFGDIATELPTDAFFLRTEFHGSEIELAYVVTTDAAIEAGGGVWVRVGVLGEGIIDSGDPDGASFGFNGNPRVCVICIPEPSTGLLAGLASLLLVGMRHRTRLSAWGAWNRRA